MTRSLLVGEGKLLKAQRRLGHCDPATTLRHYAHATPLDDQDIADDIDELLNRATDLGGEPPQIEWATHQRATLPLNPRPAWAPDDRDSTVSVGLLVSGMVLLLCG